MSTLHQRQHAAAPHAPAMSRPLKVALLALAVAGGVYLLREHGDHLAANWILLLLLACPLMHLFHGHGGHAAHGAVDDRTAPPRQRLDREE